MALEVLATDVDAVGLERAERGCYSPSSLKDLPAGLLDLAFARPADGLCVRAEYRLGVGFNLQDVRCAIPPGPFHLILCRNVVFTYFDAELQREALDRILTRLSPQGLIVISVASRRCHREPPGSCPGARSPGYTGVQARSPSVTLCLALRRRGPPVGDELIDDRSD